MLNLFNIKRKDDKISADYLPEGSVSKGSVTIDVNTLEVTNEIVSAGYGHNHAVLELKRLAKTDGALPSAKKVVWY